VCFDHPPEGVWNDTTASAIRAASSAANQASSSSGGRKSPPLGALIAFSNLFATERQSDFPSNWRPLSVLKFYALLHSRTNSKIKKMSTSISFIAT
jgi:hypothetical protein